MSDLDSESRRAARAYLLGNLSGAEATRLEIEVMMDAELGERIAAAENELIDDYVEGGLVPEEKQRFESIYMAVPERGLRVRFARELVDRAGAASRPGRHATRLQVSWRLLLPLAATLVIAIAVWTFSDGRSGARSASAPPATPTPSGAPVLKSPSQTPPPSSLQRVRFVLALGMSRSSEPTPRPFAIPSDADIVDLEIDLEGEARFSHFDARLFDSSGGEFWSSSKEPPLRPTSDGVLLVSVPVSPGLAARGTCELELTGFAARGEPSRLPRILIPFVIP